MVASSPLNFLTRRPALTAAALLAGLLPLASAQAFAPLPKPAPKTETALFTFDTMQDGAAPLFDQTVKGLKGTFDAPGGAVLDKVGRMPSFSGHYLFLADGGLTLTFDKPVSEVSLDFLDTSFFRPTTLTLSDGKDSVFGTGQRYAGIGPFWLSSGVLDLKGTSPFTQVTLGSTDHLPFGIDNVKAVVAPVPEASSVVSLALLLAGGGLLLAARRQKARA